MAASGAVRGVPCLCPAADPLPVGLARATLELVWTTVKVNASANLPDSESGPGTFCGSHTAGEDCALSWCSLL